MIDAHVAQEPELLREASSLRRFQSLLATERYQGTHPPLVEYGQRRSILVNLAAPSGDMALGSRFQWNQV
ncbi:hypothetical protein C8Q70DRAFT_989175 [Cubamyces menziesii]|nr:hypothetical protein C8Q70DRAFT_989175 [Cubamyces menziesii]